MNCSEVQKHIALFDEEKSGELNSKIAEHLKTCEHCRKLYSSLKKYETIMDEKELADVPGEFEANVISRIETGKRSNTRNVYKYSYGFVAAAVIIIMIFIYTKENNTVQNIYEVNFSLNSEKQGKGPADIVDFEKIDNEINKIISSNSASMEPGDINEVTGYYNDILVNVPAEHVSKFITDLKSKSALNLGLPNILPEEDMYTFKINFDMINFTAANILGDKKDELVVQFISGAYKGRWMVYERTGSEFSKYYELKIIHADSSLTANYTMESGDLNNDGYDDILLYEYNNFSELTLRVLINNKNMGLVEASDYSAGLKLPDKGKFVSIKPYDVDHNGTDDLLWLSVDDSANVTFTGINIQTAYKSVKVNKVNGSLSQIFPGDFTNDKLMDVVLKQTEDGESILLTGNEENGFNHPLEFHRSFAGDYYIFQGDYNGDGLTDLFVKDGGPFLSGTFYLIISADNGSFEGAPRFTLTYPSETLQVPLH